MHHWSLSINPYKLWKEEKSQLLSMKVSGSVVTLEYKSEKKINYTKQLPEQISQAFEI